MPFFRALVACLLVCPAAAFAGICENLPSIAWNNSARIDLTLLGIVNASVKHTAPVKALYAYSLCGVEPQRFEKLVNEGRGEVFSLAPNLAASLDQVTAHFPRVDYVYVRGGGPNRPLVVILFANGYQGDLFIIDVAKSWTQSQAERVGRIWNALPYDYVRRASTWLHDAARYESTFGAAINANILGVIPLAIPVAGYQSSPGRGLANPLGSVMVPDGNVDLGANFWVHELAHFNNYALSGAQALFYADEFAQISRHNATVREVLDGKARTLTGSVGGLPDGFLKDLGRLAGDVVLPLVFVENEVAAQQAYKTQCRGSWWQGPGHPPFYASGYGFCGETVLEDFGDALSIAVGATSNIDRIRAAKSAGREHPAAVDNAFDEYLANNEYSLDKLYGRSGTSGDIVNKKVAFIAKHFSYHDTEPMDADGDGVKYIRGQAKGLPQVDCDDTNPARGSCLAQSCDSVSECDDDKSCTLDSCAQGLCVNTPNDADGDGVLPTECGGTDCDDTNGATSPNLPERCGDGFDNNCDSKVDDATSSDATRWYVDADGDGYGTGIEIRACLRPGMGWSQLFGDCDDRNADIKPGAIEDCTSTVDLNCDGRAGGDDADGDGIRGCAGDCNDSRKDIYPTAIEACDGVDNNCNNQVDENASGAGASCNSMLPGVCAAGVMLCQSGSLSCAVAIAPNTRVETCNGVDDDCDGAVDDGVTQVFYADADGDGFGDPKAPISACGKPAGAVSNALDCSDLSALAHPGQTQFFENPYPTDRSGGLDYDYDCDRRVTPQRSEVYSCAPGVVSVDLHLGWEGGAPAPCGQTRNFLDAGQVVTWSWFGCWPSWQQRTQACR